MRGFVSDTIEKINRVGHVRPWVTESVCASILGLAACYAALFFGFLGPLENTSLDWRLRNFPRPETASRNIALVLIDQNSVLHFEKQLGRWPWKRSAYPPLLEVFRKGGARLVVFDLLFSESSDEDEDAVFAEAVKKKRDVIFSFQVAHPDDETRIGGKRELSPGGPSPDSLKGLRIREWGPAVPPISILSSAALSMGFVNLFADSDGTTRRMPLLLRRGGGTHESLALTAARRFLGRNGAPAPVFSSEAGDLVLAGRRIPVTGDGNFLLRYHGPFRRSFPAIFPAGAVLQGWIDIRAGRAPRLDPEVFRDKIVLVGATAAGTFDLRATPFSPADPGIFLHATAISNLLEGYFLRPAGKTANYSVMVLIVLFSSLIIVSHMRLLFRIGALAAVAGLFLIASIILTVWGGIWIEVIVPMLGFVVATGSGLSLTYLREGRQRALVKRIFTHYMNPDLVEILVSNPGQVRLGGERRILSIFFSDLENFTNLSDRLEPEQLVWLLNIYLTEMSEIILKYEGFIDKYEGDAIMAAFGTPIPFPDHARRACWAALENVERLSRLMGELEDGSYCEAKGIQPIRMPPDFEWNLNVRIGVNSGPVVAGNMGSMARMDYTVMGGAVNLASRLESANKSFGTRIIAGEETVRLAGDSIEVRVLDLLRVRGKNTPVWTYEVMARGGALSPQQATLRGHFLDGHRAYLERRWEEASGKFRDALQADPSDRPSQIYLERCRNYRESPPPDDWQGVFTMATK